MQHLNGWFEVDTRATDQEASLIKASSVVAVVKNKPEDGEDAGCVVVFKYGSITTTESYEDIIVKLEETLCNI